MNKIIIALLIMGLGVGATVLLIKSKPQSTPVEAEEKTWTVEVMTAQLQSLPPQLQLYARVESLNSAELSAAINADVQDIAVREGDTVSKGSVLLRLDQREAQLALQQREADLEDVSAAISSEKNSYANHLKALPREKTLLKLSVKAAERAKSLKKQRATSASALEEAQQGVERQALIVNARQLQINNHPVTLKQLKARQQRAQAQRDLAQLDLARSLIKAPFDGIIARVPVSLGERVRIGTPLLSIYDTQALEARSQIPARYLHIIFNALQQQQTLVATAQSKGQLIKLELARLAGEVQNNSGGTDALFRVQEGASALRLGGFLEIRLELPAQHQVIAVPYEAIYGNDKLYTLVNGRMQQQSVERLGEYENAAKEPFTLVRAETLQEGAQIILTHLPNAMEGLKVRKAAVAL